MSIHDRLRATAERLILKNGWDVQFQTFTKTTDSVGGQVKSWSNYGSPVKVALQATTGGKVMEQFRVVPRAKYAAYVYWTGDDDFYNIAKAGRMRLIYQGMYFDVKSAVIHGDRVLIEMALEVGGPIN